MRRTISRSIVIALAALGLFAAACGGEKGGPAPTGSAAPEAKASAVPTGTGAVQAVTTSTQFAAPASAAPSAEPAAATPSSSAVASASPSGAASAAPATTGSAASGPKTFDCGAKGQKPCPMQGWMKGVMAGASSSGDGEKLASALSYVASHTPPGFGGWSAIASAGAAKAKAGDIDGAKASCKQCHDQFKEKYKSTMRDRPF